jgi:hypothetical protein
MQDTRTSEANIETTERTIGLLTEVRDVPHQPAAAQ